MQRKEIAQQLMNTIHSVFPETNHLILATRKANTLGCRFYFKNGFSKCSYLPLELDPELYIGLEKYITPSLRAKA